MRLKKNENGRKRKKKITKFEHQQHTYTHTAAVKKIKCIRNAEEELKQPSSDRFVARVERTLISILYIVYVLCIDV